MANEQPLDQLIPRLIRELEDSAQATDEYASRGLERIGAPAVAPLIALLGDKAASAGVRGWAARTLGNIGDKRAYQAMVSTLNDQTEDIGVRQMVAFYLGRLRDWRATVPLIDIMENRAESADLRRHAIYGLSELGDPDAVGPLLEMVTDEEVENASSSALEEMRDPRAASALLPFFAADDVSLRQRAAAIVGKLGTQVLEELLAALQSGDWRVRWSGATALGFVESERAVDPLIATLQSDAIAAVRTQAATALGFSPGERVVGPLTHALLHEDDVHVRQASVQSLYNLASQQRVGSEILPVLETAANDAGTIEGLRVVSLVAQKTIHFLKLWQSEPEPPYRR